MNTGSTKTTQDDILMTRSHLNFLHGVRRLPKYSACLGLCLLILLPASWLSSCYDEKFTTDSSDTLRIGVDTLTFDTVLTQISTVTRYFKVFNPHDASIKISEIKVIGNNAAFFTLNVDGYSGEVINDVEISPEDSIYVFVDAVVDPDQPLSVSPFILEAEVRFVTNGTAQEVTLIAWGQNANYIPGPDQPNRISLLTCDLGEVIWDDPKPYVLYGTLLIDSCNLILPAGTRLYVHGGIANNQIGIYNEGLIYTLPDGRITVQGTTARPVIITDDRIEPDHTGTWAGIRIGPDSGPHQFSYLQLSNAIAGITADSASVVGIDHTIISFTGGPGFFARHADATITNTLFYENGGQSVSLTYGGKYDLTYCTMASFGNDAEAIFLSNYYCTDPLCSEGTLLNPLQADIRNCIMVGSSTDEVWMINATEQAGFFDVQMKDNIVVVDELLDPNAFPEFFQTICTDCFEYAFGDTLFVDMVKNDYHLDTMSIAIMKAKPIASIPDDLDNKPRDIVAPDLGCYEFQE